MSTFDERMIWMKEGARQAYRWYEDKASYVGWDKAMKYDPESIPEGEDYMLNTKLAKQLVARNMRQFEKKQGRLSGVEEEIWYAKKWDEIWEGDKNTKAYKRLEQILDLGVRRRRSQYGKFWEE